MDSNPTRSSAAPAARHAPAARLLTWLPYLALSLAILLPLLKPGFVFALDMVFAPEIKLPAEVGSSYLFYVALHVLNFVVPADWLQKGILLAILLLSGLGAHRMAAYFLRDAAPASRSRAALQAASGAAPAAAPLPFAALACYAAGVLYMVNPFVYSRFMAGQFAVLLGYALLPGFAYAVWALVRQPSARRSGVVAAWAAAIGIVSVHTLGLAAVVAAVATAVAVWQNRRNRSRLAALGKYGGLAVGLALLASSYWLVPALLGHGRLADAVGGFSQADRQAFATVPGELGRELNVLALQGFWAEATDLFMLPHDVSSWWLPWLLLLWTVVGVGFVAAWRRQRGVAASFAAIGLAGWLLALGSTGTIAAPLNNWLAGHVPFFGGYREPQKFIALVALSYAYCATFGAAALAGRAQTVLPRFGRQAGLVVAAALVALPLAYSPLMLWGFNGQLQARQYPGDWHEINQYLNRQPGEFKVLFVPWHLYMRYGFAGRVIASPAAVFFDRPVVLSNDPEIGGIQPRPNRLTGTLLEPYVTPDGRQRGNLARELARHDIRYIVLAKEADYKDYEFLKRDPHLTFIKETQNLRLFVIKL